MFFLTEWTIAFEALLALARIVKAFDEMTVNPELVHA